MIPLLSALNLAEEIKIGGFVVIFCIFGGGSVDFLFSVIMFFK